MAKPRVSSLSIQFDNPDALHNFWVWLCEQGEQDYWVWMQERENEEDGDITVISFEYDKADRGLITTKCGRFDGSSSNE